GLRSKPAYLLVFGICALFFLTGVGTIFAGLARDNNWTTAIGACSFLIALMAAVTVVWQVEGGPRNAEVGGKNYQEPGKLREMINSFGIEIHGPKSLAVITGKTNVYGSIVKPLPEGYELCILRGYPGGGFLPDEQYICVPDRHKWYVQKFDIGGQ